VSKTDQFWSYVTDLLLAQDSLSMDNQRLIYIRKALLIAHVASFGGSLVSWQW